MRYCVGRDMLAMQLGAAYEEIAVRDAALADSAAYMQVSVRFPIGSAPCYFIYAQWLSCSYPQRRSSDSFLIA